MYDGAFGNGAVFVERLVHRPRHIEVQVVADSTGNVDQGQGRGLGLYLAP